MGSRIRLALCAVFAAAAFAVASGHAVAGTQCGKAAWYDLGGKTASGESANGRLMTAAHRTLPFGTKVKVENLANGRVVIVRINDRGPFGGGRVIDLSRAAAEKLGYISAGVARVRVSVVDGDPSDLTGNCAGGKPAIVEASLSSPDKPVDVPAPRPRPRPSAEPVDALNEPVDRLDEPLSEDEVVAPIQPKAAIVAAPAERAAEPTYRPVRRATVAARPHGGNPLAQRFSDAFAPADSFVVDSLALGYADPR